MFGICYRGQDLLGLLLSPALIPGFLIPVFHDSPIPSEVRVDLGLVLERRFKAGDLQQPREVMHVIPTRILGWEVVLLRLSSDAGLQSTFDRVPQI